MNKLVPNDTVRYNSQYENDEKFGFEIVTLYCSNCGTDLEIALPKGQYVIDCPSCGGHIVLCRKCLDAPCADNEVCTWSRRKENETCFRFAKRENFPKALVVAVGE